MPRPCQGIRFGLHRQARPPSSRRRAPARPRSRLRPRRGPRDGVEFGHGDPPPPPGLGQPHRRGRSRRTPGGGGQGAGRERDRRRRLAHRHRPEGGRPGLDFGRRQRRRHDPGGVGIGGRAPLHLETAGRRSLAHCGTRFPRRGLAVDRCRQPDADRLAPARCRECLGDHGRGRRKAHPSRRRPLRQARGSRCAICSSRHRHGSNS